MEMLEYTAQNTNTLDRLPTQSNHTSINASYQRTLLDSIFPTQTEDAKVANLRKALGEKATYFSDEELLAMAIDMQQLIEGWLDDFEKDLFDGRTLENLLKGTDNGY